MAEHLSHHEHEPHHELEPKPEAEHRKQVEHHKQTIEHDSEKLEALKHKVEAEAKSSRETKVEDEDKVVKQAHSHLVGKQLKNEAFKRSINRTRKQLSKPNRAFSKLVHQPVVDAVSRAGAQTIARPKGLLVGSILALAGSSYLLWSAKHYGYTYNYLVVILLFATGYILGLIIELIWFTLRPKKNR